MDGPKLSPENLKELVFERFYAKFATNMTSCMKYSYLQASHQVWGEYRPTKRLSCRLQLKPELLWFGSSFMANVLKLMIMSC